MSITTYPFCISCGYDLKNHPNFKNDQFCDSCGFEYQFSSPAFNPPTGLQGVPGPGDVSFLWTANLLAGLTQSSFSDDGLATWSPWATDTTPTAVAAATGTTVGIRVRSVVDGVPGPYREITAVTA